MEGDRVERLRVLFVPDTVFWVTGTIAREIARNNAWIEPTICSRSVLDTLLLRDPGLLDRIDLAHFMTPHIATSFLPRFEGRMPCVTTIHHVEDEKSVEPEPRCDAVQTVSDQWHDHLVANGVDPEKLVKLTNGVRVDQFRPPSSDEQARLRRKLGLPPDGLVVGFNAKRSSDTFGRKGIDVLVWALTELRRREPGISCLLVGPGWSELADQLGEQGAACVHLPFILERSELAEVYRTFDIFWTTSRIEGGPVPLLEAMATGACCVTTPVGIAREIVRNGENAFLAPLDDVATFVERTVELAADPELRARIGLAARQSILDGYTWERTTRSAHSLYGTAVDRFRRRCPEVPVCNVSPQDLNLSPNRSDELSAISAGMRSWVRAREYLWLSELLRRMGAYRSAERAATRAILLRPWDHSLWREAGPVSRFASPYRLSGKLLRGVRSLPSLLGLSTRSDPPMASSESREVRT